MAHVSDVLCFEIAKSGLRPVVTSATTLNELSQSLPQGVYTSFRTYPGNRVLRLDAHLDRLVESAAIEGVTLTLDRHAVRQAIASALGRSSCALARMRLTVGFAPEIIIFVSLTELHELPETVYAQGVRCTVADRTLHRELPRSKATRFIAPGTAARAAASDAEEVLLVSDHQQILEGSSSNFFAVCDGVLRTAGDGVLAGVTRGIVLAVAEGLLPIEYLPVALDDLPSLQEAFVTSVSRAVLPVVAIDGATLGTGLPGPYTREIMRRFQARLEAELEPVS